MTATVGQRADRRTVRACVPAPPGRGVAGSRAALPQHPRRRSAPARLPAFPRHDRAAVRPARAGGRADRPGDRRERPRRRLARQHRGSLPHARPARAGDRALRQGGRARPEILGGAQHARRPPARHRRHRRRDRHYQKAVAAKPDLASARHNLAALLLEQGRANDAADAIWRALAVQDTEASRVLLVQSVRNARKLPGDPGFRAVMTRAVTEVWGRPVELAGAALTLVRSRPGDPQRHPADQRGLAATDRAERYSHPRCRR